MAAPIFVTGGTGFIGRRLVRDLAGEGHSVRLLSRCPRKARRLFADLGDAVEAIPGDLLDPASLERGSAGAETVYHIGGVYRFGLRHRAQVWEANVEGTENVLRAARKGGVGRVVHVSSGGVLRSNETRDLGEGDFPDSPPPFSSYKYSKWHAERRVLEWAAKGFPVAIASPTCPIGAEDEGPTPTGRMIRDFVAGHFPCYCRTGLNFIDVGDVSAGLRRVAAAGRSGGRYILGDRNLWLKEFLGLLEEETGRRAPRVRLPQWLIWIAGGAGEAIDVLRLGSGDIQVCLETAYFSGRIQFFDNTRTRMELGWEPVRSVRHSVRDAVAWFRGEMAAPAVEPEPEPV